LGFLGAQRLPYENKRKPLLDFLGFPWILSSESRLIKGLRGTSVSKDFRDDIWRDWLGPAVGAVWKGMIDHGESLL
jgi:hypothetical protein